MNYKTFITAHAVDFTPSWGRWAACRFVMNRTGWNEATALRCMQAVKLCRVMQQIEVV